MISLALVCAGLLWSSTVASSSPAEPPAILVAPPAPEASFDPEPSAAVEPSASPSHGRFRRVKAGGRALKNATKTVGRGIKRAVTFPFRKCTGGRRASGVQGAQPRRAGPQSLRSSYGSGSSGDAVQMRYTGRRGQVSSQSPSIGPQLPTSATYGRVPAPSQRYALAPGSSSSSGSIESIYAPAPTRGTYAAAPSRARHMHATNHAAGNASTTYQAIPIGQTRAYGQLQVNPHVGAGNAAHSNAYGNLSLSPRAATAATYVRPQPPSRASVVTEI